MALTNNEVKTPRIKGTVPNNGRVTTSVSGSSTSSMTNGSLNEPQVTRRAKRSLTMEKERSSPRSVKLLRRCKVQSSDTLTKSQLHLPKVNKNSKTP